MQNILPVGIAMIERVKEGGAQKVVEVFKEEKEPFEYLREEGEPAAQSVRRKLDEFSPGLGNPVIPVEIAIENVDDEGLEDQDDINSLVTCLERVQDRLDDLKIYLDDDQHGVNP